MIAHGLMAEVTPENLLVVQANIIARAKGKEKAMFLEMLEQEKLANPDFYKCKCGGKLELLEGYWRCKNCGSRTN